MREPPFDLRCRYPELQVAAGFEHSLQPVPPADEETAPEEPPPPSVLGGYA